MSTVPDSIKAALSAEGDDLWLAIKTQHPDALENASLNRHLIDDMALYIAKNKNTTAETLGFLAGDVRFKEVYRVKLAIAKNPKTPQRIALSLIKYLRIFDLADLTRDKRIPSIFRQKVELVITEKMPALPEGIKIALAKRACAELVITLMERSDQQVIDACLESPILTEEHIRPLVLLQRTKHGLIKSIAEHPKWSLRYSIKYALLRNAHTPMKQVEKFIEGTKVSDLQDLYDDPKVPAVTKPFIYRELKSRDASLEPMPEEVYELQGDEDEDLKGQGGES
jgi:hypothetical protein